MIPWDQSFTTGIDIIDQQHKILFSIGKKLEMLLQVPDGVSKKDDAIKVIGDFRNYITYHFYTEEKLMESLNYPHIEKHKISHESYKKQILSLDLEKIYEENYDELRTLLNSLYSWIFNHVSTEASHYKEYMDKQ